VSDIFTPSALAERIGQEVAVSEWVEVTQGKIDQFASTTGDRNWIHLDQERAARESPYKSTIAHGFLTLSLLSAFADNA
jgi:acyl dehydratase